MYYAHKDYLRYGGAINDCLSLFPLGQSQSKVILPGPTESLAGESFSLGGKKVGNHGRWQIELI